MTYPSSSEPTKQACIGCGRRIAEVLWRLGSAAVATAFVTTALVGFPR